MTVDPMSMMDFTVDDALAADEELRAKKGEKDKRICACGHAMARHLSEYGINQCRPSAMHCACKNSRPVLEASDIRFFLRRTEGGGPLHALGRGIGIAVSKGIEIKWLVELKCDRCQKTDVKLTPMPVTQSGIAANRDTGYNALLCPECREAV